MYDLLEFFKGIGAVQTVLLCTLFTWAMTAVGASIVFTMKNVHRRYFDIMLGFTGGIMLSASFWSLLLPSIQYAEQNLTSARWIPTSLGFLFGALFLYGMDKLTPHLHINFGVEESEGLKTQWHKSTLLILAITLHNIPEGLAIGILVGAAFLENNDPMLISAIMLTLGIGIQNLPEGLAVSIPLRRYGVSRFKSFWYGQLSAVVEPFAGILGVLAVVYLSALLPYALAFAAGAMIYVVIEEVIPESQRDQYTDQAAIGFILGFTLMMILDTSIRLTE